jgi:glycerol-3-phosphate dehydrogenase (NAD(P)+)
VARGGTLEEFQERTKMVAEGAVAAASIYELSQREKIEMPITKLIYQILYENLNPERVVNLLMSRPQGKED